jgi:hypothetical protein
MLETIVRAFISLINGVLALFGIVHAVDKHLSENSTVGRSKIDEDSHNFRENIFHSWWLISLLLLLFFGGAGFSPFGTHSPAEKTGHDTQKYYAQRCGRRFATFCGNPHPCYWCHPRLNQEFLPSSFILLPSFALPC